MFFKRYKIKKIALIKNVFLLFVFLSNSLFGMEKQPDPTQEILHPLQEEALYEDLGVLQKQQIEEEGLREAEAALYQALGYEFLGENGQEALQQQTKQNNFFKFFKNTCWLNENEFSDYINKSINYDGIDINYRDEEGCTALHYACLYQEEDKIIALIKRLVQNGAQLTLKNKKNQTPLHILCYKSTHFETISKFFKFMNQNDEEKITEYLNMQDNDGNSPFYYACQKKNPSKEIIEALITNFKPELNVQNKQGNTSLHCILTNLYNNDDDQKKKITEDIVGILIRAGSQLDIKNNQGISPRIMVSLINQEKGSSIVDENILHEVHKDNNINNNNVALELYDFTLDLDNFEEQKQTDDCYTTVNVHQQLMIPSASNVLKLSQQLLACCSSEDISVQKICELIHLGADVNYKDHTNDGPLHYACSNTHVTFDIIKLLIEKGALIKAENIHGHTPAISYMTHHKDIKKDITEFFINNNGFNTYNQPLNYLSVALSSDFFPITELLLTKGALLKKTPILYHACEGGNTEKIKFLIENGADVNYRYPGSNQTPLHIACKRKHEEAVKLLIENGADLNAEDNYKNTPLHFAANAEIGIMLISNGADYTIKNKGGKTPLNKRSNKRTHNEKIKKMNKYIKEKNLKK